MEGFVYIDGAVVPAADARISVFDRGLLYGDGLFETMRVEGGRVHLRERHLRRLRQSAAALEIAMPDDEEVRTALRRTTEANHCDRCILRLTLTRGMTRGGPGSDTESSTLMVTLRPLLQALDQQSVARLVTLQQPHQTPETPTRIKSLSYLGYVLAAREVARRGADEGVMLTREGFVAEGSISTIFVVHDRVLMTAPIELGVLPGIARGRVLELARALGYETIEHSFTIDELRGAGECFFTNAARGVVPVGSIDETDFAASRPMTTALRDAYVAEMPDELC